jgi:hypothetical protein
MIFFRLGMGNLISRKYFLLKWRVCTGIEETDSLMQKRPASLLHQLILNRLTAVKSVCTEEVNTSSGPVLGKKPMQFAYKMILN